MIQDTLPKVPNLPPLIANGDANRGYYVCTYKNKWDSEKKRSVRVSSTSVGRVQGKAKFGLIEFYDEFIKQYPGLKRFQVFRTEGPQRLLFIPKTPKRKRKEENIKTSAELVARVSDILGNNINFDDDLDLDSVSKK